jgi:hypothetical protein
MWTRATRPLCKAMLKVKLRGFYLILYIIIFLSGSEDDDTLKSGVITCSLGARYKNYCSNISRTYLVDPSPVLSCGSDAV